MKQTISELVGCPEIARLVPADAEIQYVRHSMGGLVCFKDSSAQVPSNKPFWDPEYNDDHQSICKDAYEIRVVYGKTILGAVQWDHARIGRGWAESRGTFVAKKYRRTGLATALWLEMLTLRRPMGVSVKVVTDAGLRFTDELALRINFLVKVTDLPSPFPRIPGVKLYVWDDRPGRDES